MRRGQAEGGPELDAGMQRREGSMEVWQGLLQEGKLSG